ncbi:MAG: hypothetical protein CMJ76_06305 [Planctomycetaceae bacterium]|nr:hypothetical protein [Planctomycetaceae bacterium]
MTRDVNTDRLELVWDRLNHWHHHDGVRAISAETGSADGVAGDYYCGFDDISGKILVNRDSRFLIASPTKPFIACAVMMLVEQGELKVSDRVSRYLPEFGKGDKSHIRIAHLLTHTSGLPDMLPNNLELRKERAPLSEYQKYANKVDLVCPPGTRVHYQSMGILTLSTIIEAIISNPTSEFLAERIFEPLKMNATMLGATDECLLSHKPPVDSMVEETEGHDQWGWNSRYWRMLGAPWGGLISTSADLGTFCRHLLGIHQGHRGIISPATLLSMTTNQLGTFPKVPIAIANSLPWGYGWQLNWPNHPRGFGSILPPESYGHWGATGTLIWIDPTCKAYGVVLTNEPMELEGRRQIEFANLSRIFWD